MGSKGKRMDTTESSIAEQARALIENSLQNTSGNCSRLSTSRKRSLYLSDIETDLECPENDHIREKEERRLQEATKKNLELQDNKIQKDKEVQKTPLLNTLTSEELDQHYYHCCNLFAKNKVTSQNAFKLQLIDYMKMMVVEKNEKADNLTLMSCTLDASAKIYSCRVDKVYSDMVKHLSENLANNDDDDGVPKEKRKKKNKESKDNDSDEDEVDENGFKIKSRKHSWPKSFRFVKKKGSFEKKVIEQVFHGDNLPRGQEYFLQFPLSSTGSELVMSKPLIDGPSSDIKANEFTYFDPYQGGCDNDRLSELIPGYCELQTKMVVIEDASDKSQVVENSFTYDPEEAQLAAKMEVTEHGNSDGENDADFNNEVDYDEIETMPSVQDGSETPLSKTVSSITSGPGRSNVCLTPAALTRFLRPAALGSAKPSDESSIFDVSKLEFLAGASHWKIKSSQKRASTGMKTPKTESKGSRSHVVIDFSEEHCMSSWQALLDEDGCSAKKLSMKTISDWRHKVKNTWPKDILFTQKILLSTFTKRIPFKLHTKDITQSDNNDLEDSVMYSQHEFTDVIRDDGDDIEDGFAPLDNEPMPDDEEVMPSVEESKSKIDITVEELLQPRVQVEKNTITFAKVQKRVDVRELKSVMWTIMDLEDEKENRINNCTQETKKKTDFRHILNELPKKLPDTMVNNVSVPMAFLSMLFLANEKCLRIEPSESSNIDVYLD